jgi:hypothetical protein
MSITNKKPAGQKKKMPKLFRQKVDHMKFLCPGSYKIDSPEVQKIIEELGLELEQVGFSSLWRDEKKHIAMRFIPRMMTLEFNGQFFKSEKDFDLVRNYVRSLNKHLEIKLWRLSRLDLASDFEFCTPDQLIPFFNGKFWTNHGEVYHPYLDLKASGGLSSTPVYQSSNLFSKEWEARAYDKTLLLNSKYRGKEFPSNIDSRYLTSQVSRLEFEIKSKKALVSANALINNEINYSEHEFFQDVLIGFLEKKQIRIVNPKDSNKSRWKLYWSYQAVLNKGYKRKDIPPMSFVKVEKPKKSVERDLFDTVNPLLHPKEKELIKSLVTKEVALILDDRRMKVQNEIEAADKALALKTISEETYRIFIASMIRIHLKAK